MTGPIISMVSWTAPLPGDLARSGLAPSASSMEVLRIDDASRPACPSCLDLLKRMLHAAPAGSSAESQLGRLLSHLGPDGRFHMHCDDETASVHTVWMRGDDIFCTVGTNYDPSDAQKDYNGRFRMEHSTSYHLRDLEEQGIGTQVGSRDLAPVAPVIPVAPLGPRHEPEESFLSRLSSATYNLIRNGPKVVPVVKSTSTLAPEPESNMELEPVEIKKEPVLVELNGSLKAAYGSIDLLRKGMDVFLKAYQPPKNPDEESFMSEDEFVDKVSYLSNLASDVMRAISLVEDRLFSITKEPSLATAVEWQMIRNQLPVIVEAIESVDQSMTVIESEILKSKHTRLVMEVQGLASHVVEINEKLSANVEMFDVVGSSLMGVESNVDKVPIVEHLSYYLNEIPRMEILQSMSASKAVNFGDSVARIMDILLDRRQNTPSVQNALNRVGTSLPVRFIRGFDTCQDKRRNANGYVVVNRKLLGKYSWMEPSADYSMKSKSSTTISAKDQRKDQGALGGADGKDDKIVFHKGILKNVEPKDTKKRKSLVDKLMQQSVSQTNDVEDALLFTPTMPEKISNLAKPSSAITLSQEPSNLVMLDTVDLDRGPSVRSMCRSVSQHLMPQTDPAPDLKLNQANTETEDNTSEKIMQEINYETPDPVGDRSLVSFGTVSLKSDTRPESGNEAEREPPPKKNVTKRRVSEGKTLAELTQWLSDATQVLVVTSPPEAKVMPTGSQSKRNSIVSKPIVNVTRLNSNGAKPANVTKPAKKYKLPRVIKPRRPSAAVEQVKIVKK